VLRVRSIFLVYIFVVLGVLTTNGQEITAKYIFDTNPLPKELSKTFRQNEFRDSLEFVTYLDSELKDLYMLSYFSASVDSIVSKQNHKTVFLYLGKSYDNIIIRYEAKYNDILRKVNSKYLDNKSLGILDFKYENQKIIDYLDEHAFPNAKVYIDSITFESNLIAGKLIIDRANPVYYGKIKSTGDIKISKSFLQGYTGLKQGKPYNLKKISNAKKLINDLTFASQAEELSLSYKEDTVDVAIPINKVSGNRFDGILGILPNDKTTGKTLITGELNIALQNIFRSAEQIKFEWKKLESSSQTLLIEFMVPYVFNTSFGLSSDLNLVKQDTSFLNANISLSGLYFLGANNYVGLKYLNKTSSSLIDKELYDTEFKDFTINSYGATLKYTNLDYNFNPRKGLDIELEAYLGTKNSPSEDIKTSTQSELKSDMDFFLPLKRRSTVLFSLKAASLNSKQLYTNELFRIGGLSTIRGFNEASIYASSYGIFSLEYRFIFERNSALFAFVDAAWIEKKQENYFYDYPIGAGLGLFFKTKAGIFTISYAMGQQKNEQFAIKNAKIHFGFINRF
jgi:outer membrane translocation and assembly module TamA